MSLIQHEQEKQVPQASMFSHGGAVYMTSGNISPYPGVPMQQPAVLQAVPMQPMHAVPAVPPVESVFRNATAVQPQAAPLCVPVQSVHVAQPAPLPNGPFFCVQ